MLDRETIRQTLIELIEADTGEKFPDLDDGKNLRDELGLDSVDVVSIVSQIERRFRIRLTHQELETLVTVGDVLNLLETKLAAPAVEACTGLRCLRGLRRTTKDAKSTKEQAGEERSFRVALFVLFACRPRSPGGVGWRPVRGMPLRLVPGRLPTYAACLSLSSGPGMGMTSFSSAIASSRPSIDSRQVVGVHLDAQHAGVVRHRREA